MQYKPTKKTEVALSTGISLLLLPWKGSLLLSTTLAKTHWNSNNWSEAICQELNTVKLFLCFQKLEISSPFGEADKIYFLGEDESNYWGRIKFTVEERSNFDFIVKGGVSFFCFSANGVSWFLLNEFIFFVNLCILLKDFCRLNWVAFFFLHFNYYCFNASLPRSNDPFHGRNNKEIPVDKA